VVGGRLAKEYQLLLHSAMQQRCCCCTTFCLAATYCCSAMMHCEMIDGTDRLLLQHAVAEVLACC
jgi:hypothetical protein